VVELDEAIAALGAYSLLRRNATEKTLSIHRLVQVVLRDQMEEQNEKQWAERAVRVVNTAFPDIEHQNWPQCDRLLPHALVCAKLSAQHGFHFTEVARLLQQTGWYLAERAATRRPNPS